MVKISSELWQKIHRIELKTSRLVDSVLGGQYLSVFKGSGLEFEEVRPYQESDDERHIDWNVSARTGQLHVKQYIEERELIVIFLVDISPSVYFGSQGQLKIEQAVELCASIAFSALRNNDRVGLLTFDNDIQTFLPPKKGRRHTLRLLRELLLSYEHMKPGRQTDLNTPINYINRILHRRSIIFLFSDFLDTDFIARLRILQQHHDCVVVMLRDLRDTELPSLGLVELWDPETQEHQLVDLSRTSFRDAYRDRMLTHYENLDRQLKGGAIDRITLNTSTNTLNALLSFFKRRRHSRR